MSGALRGLLGLVLLLATSCGGLPSGLVVVRVSGLIGSITELYVTMQLDGMPATNSHPQTAGMNMAFVVYDDMQRFGVQVPAGTGSLSLSIIGYNTNLETVRTGTGSLDLTQGTELDVTLTAP